MAELQKNMWFSRDQQTFIEVQMELYGKSRSSPEVNAKLQNHSSLGCCSLIKEKDRRAFHQLIDESVK